jgi:hypothetical protein
LLAAFNDPRHEPGDKLGVGDVALRLRDREDIQKIMTGRIPAARVRRTAKDRDQ